MTGSLVGMDATIKAVGCKIALCVEWICATTAPRGIHTTLPGLLARTAAKRSVEDVITDVRVATHHRFMTITVVGVKETRFSEKTKSINFIFDVLFLRNVIPSDTPLSTQVVS